MKHTNVRDLISSFQADTNIDVRNVIGEKIWEHFYWTGAKCFDEGDYMGAINQHLAALEYNEYAKDDALSTLLLSLGVEHEKLEKYSDAISYYEKLLSVESLSSTDKALALEYMGQCYEKIGDTENAYKYLTKRLSIEPPAADDWYLAYRYAMLASKLNHNKNAKRYYEIALKIIPTKKEKYRQAVLQSLANQYLHDGHPKKAILLYRKALKISTDVKYAQSQLHYGIASAYFKLNKFKNVIQHAEIALELPGDQKSLEGVLFLLSFSWDVLGDADKSQDYRKKLIEVNPKSSLLAELL